MFAEGSDLTSEPCPFCKGTGRCATCSGTGQRILRRRWPIRNRVIGCHACRGRCECDLCHGSGKRYPNKAR